eukprot:1422421-Pleurochrysis_carterae.AAC.1
MDGVRACKSRAHARCAHTRMPDERARGAGREGGALADDGDGAGDGADEKRRRWASVTARAMASTTALGDRRRRKPGRWASTRAWPITPTTAAAMAPTRG